MFVYRCTDGHLVRLSLVNNLLSVHLGTSKYGRCPVDGRWRILRRVHRNELTERELESVHGRNG